MYIYIYIVQLYKENQYQSQIKIQINVVIENNEVGIIRTYRNGYNVT